MLPGKTVSDWIYYIHSMAQIGFDYADLPLANFLDFSDKDICLVESALNEAGIRALNWNNFMPNRFRITGEAATSEKEIREYLSEAFSVIGTGGLQAKVVVFGSPWIRKCPEGFSMSRAHDQIADVLGIAAEYAEKNGIIIAVEHNNHTETNTMPFFAGVVEMVKRLSLPCVRVLCDYYHLRADGESMDVILPYGDLISHCHIAKLKDRAYFQDDCGEEKYLTAFARNLKECKYDKTISIEAITTRERWNMEAEATLKLFRNTFL